MPRIVALTPAALVLGALCFIAPAARAAQPPRPLLNASIDETQLVTLHGNTRAAARNAANDRGVVRDDLPLDHLLLSLNRPEEKEAELKSLIEAMHTPGSPYFHKWLTPQQIGARFGLADSDIVTVTYWLDMHGFLVNSISPGGTVIDFSGNAGQVREAFHTEMHALEVDGEQHVANITDPRIPASLAPALRGIVSLNDFHPHAMHKQIMRSHIDVQTGRLVTAEAGELDANGDYTFTRQTGSYKAVVPGDLATIYNMNPLFAAGYSGQGQTIVVIEDTNLYSTKDWSTFRSAFGLARYTAGNLVQVHPGGCANPGVNADDGEAILDAEYASASAPGATIQVASCAGTQTTFGGLIALEKLINSPGKPPAIVSISYGECEAENGAAANATYNAIYQQAVAEGVSIFVSAGDEGAASCDAGAAQATHGTSVSGFATSAYDVAVGGTDFGDTYAGTTAAYWNAANTANFASARSYINEIPWNNSCAGVLLSMAATGSGVPYGSKGFCNSKIGSEYYLTTAAGSGGASSCFTGTAATVGVTSGTCRGNAKPAWQAGMAGISQDGVRDIPDVSLFAANGAWGHYYLYCFSDKANGGLPCTGAPSAWSAAGGTSFAAPIMAGIQALVNQRTGARQGNPNPVYYRLAASEYGSKGSAVCNSSRGSAVGAACTFYDVTQGDADVSCTGTHGCYRPSGSNGVLSTSSTSYKPAYGSSTGYDMATGIGSVNAYNLARNWLTLSTAKPQIALPPKY